MAAQRRIVRRGVSAAALGLVSALALAGCAEEASSGSSGSGDGVQAGASIDEYQEAFADVDPIELRAQSSGPKGSATGAPFEKWGEAVTEWSDGKITFEWSYSNSVAGPTEVDDALNDGRLDVGSTLPIYEPDEYPAMSALIQTGVLSNQTPVLGALQSNAWPNEVAFANEDVMNEQEEHGLQPLVPVFNSGSQGMFCADARTSLDDFHGLTSSASGTAQSDQVSALGASPTTIAYTEMFESLERGVVDCANASTTVGVLGGFISEVPHLTISPDAGFALAPGSWTFSKATWDELPLVAQQLLWDKVDVFLVSNAEDKVFPNHAEAARVIREEGGSVNEFADDAADAIRAENEKILDDTRQTDAVSDPDGLVDAAQETSEAWLSTLQEMGFTGELGYEDFDETFNPEDFDLSGAVETIMTEIWSAHRPE